METPVGVRTTLGKGWGSALCVAFLLAVAFLLIAAFPYLLGNEEKLSRYDGRRAWLLVHIVTATIPLLIGPVQLWLGFTSPQGKFHRKLGMIYLCSIAVSSVAAYYLAFNTGVSSTFGFGLGGLATCWVVTCTMAMLAIKRRDVRSHMQWMVRSYVATFAFVCFRVLVVAFTILDTGTMIDRLNWASWLCWVVPLVVCEMVIQFRSGAKSSTP